MTAPTIRKATPDDAEPVRRMQAKSWLDTYPNEENGVLREWVADSVRQWFEPLDEKMTESRAILTKAISDPKQFYRVAEQNDQIVGFIHGRILDDGRGEFSIYTEKSTHGSGLAAELMNLLEKFWRDNDVRIVKLRVATYNQRAINFYKKFDFEIVLGGDAMLGDKIPNIKMERKS
jgi:RimJ/RimL family protein N-acetyltransferase